MRMIFGVLGLLVVLAIVGTVAKKQLQAVSALPAPAGAASGTAVNVPQQSRNLQNQDLGRITGLIDTGANQVLVVRGERERLIPFVSAVVESVDLVRGEVAVDWGADW